MSVTLYLELCLGSGLTFVVRIVSVGAIRPVHQFCGDLRC